MALEEWRPGSFTKNFSWGSPNHGLARLHEMIQIGFEGTLEDVPRAIFRNRVENAGRPDYIALNFFLYNKTVNAVDFVVADELVFQALTAPHSDRFDRLALFAFNFSYVGKWSGAERYQSRPALWAFHYISDRVAKAFAWDASKVSANDIEKFLKESPQYKAKTARKLATNLNYLYSIGGLQQFSSGRVHRWWVDALFLALDRLLEDRAAAGLPVNEPEYINYLVQNRFSEVAGRQSAEKTLAINHLTDLYVACGSRGRFSEDAVKERTALAIPDVAWLVANDARPQGAVHPSNPAILKSIPRSCAMLARYAGFDVIDADELTSFDPVEFVRRHTRRALEFLQGNKIKPNMSAEDLRKMTREE